MSCASAVSRVYRAFTSVIDFLVTRLSKFVLYKNRLSSKIVTVNRKYNFIGKKIIYILLHFVFSR
jgi:hypothetical protein